jgi:WhiB family redox-sensing transcriptional regulator
MGAELTPEWMRLGACLNCSNSSVFFDEDRPSQVREARKICNSCPVIATCLQHALDNREIGIWGATTTNQRAKRLRMQRAVALRSA